jgi:lipid-A-disaccharide synthase
MRIFVSAGEASGDLYASRLVEILRQRYPVCEFYGVAGPRMQAAGVRAIVDQRQLAVVGLLDVVPHIPRVFSILRKVAAEVRATPTDVAILTDSAGFHLRLAQRLHAIPIVQLIAPQAWAWREYRVHTMRRTLRHLLAILPFEEEFFRDRGVPTTYIGHPLARLVRPKLSRAQLCAKLRITEAARIVAVLPGSRKGEVARHVPILAATLERLTGICPVVALPEGFGQHDFLEPFRAAAIQVIEGHTWDVLAHAELAITKSGSVTMEAAMLGTPMVTFYRANTVDWYLGRWLVKSPYLSMANILAGRRIVPELIQYEATPEKIAAAAQELLTNAEARQRMQQDLAAVRAQLQMDRDPMENAADVIAQVVRAGERKCEC